MKRRVPTRPADRGGGQEGAPPHVQRHHPSLSLQKVEVCVCLLRVSVRACACVQVRVLCVCVCARVHACPCLCELRVCVCVCVCVCVWCAFACACACVFSLVRGCTDGWLGGCPTNSSDCDELRMTRTTAYAATRKHARTPRKRREKKLNLTHGSKTRYRS